MYSRDNVLTLSQIAMSKNVQGEHERPIREAVAGEEVEDGECRRRLSGGEVVGRRRGVVVISEWMPRRARERVHEGQTESSHSCCALPVTL